ncbi:hypothetical protein FISHEDRAFT_62017 [Fistulina hepatica ATCC 64428]|nr:hypothetical protein FISHEDRAFT_62017 [Fistulina hepatica ATCC 64428]
MTWRRLLAAGYDWVRSTLVNKTCLNGRKDDSRRQRSGKTTASRQFKVKSARGQLEGQQRRLRIVRTTQIYHPYCTAVATKQGSIARGHILEWRIQRISGSLEQCFDVDFVAHVVRINVKEVHKSACATMYQRSQVSNLGQREHNESTDEDGMKRLPFPCNAFLCNMRPWIIE